MVGFLADDFVAPFRPDFALDLDADFDADFDFAFAVDFPFAPDFALELDADFDVDLALDLDAVDVLLRVDGVERDALTRSV